MDAKHTSPTDIIPRPVRWFSWILLGVLSAFFAEVTSASSPLIFFNMFGLLVTLPLYALHLLVLAPLVIQRDVKINLGALFLAGALFGLYEAYITKVLWSPPWNPDAWRVGGVAVLATLMLVFFWHPFMSFIVPLYVGDGLLGGQRTLPLTIPVKWLARLQPRWMLVIAGGLCGLIQGALVGEFGRALLSSLSSTLVVLLLVIAWQRISRRAPYDLVDLLPNRKEWPILALLLLAAYIALGFVLRREALPSLGGHITIGMLYLFLIGLLWAVRRKASRSSVPQVTAAQVTAAQVAAAQVAAAQEPAAASRTVAVPFVLTKQGWLWYAAGFVTLSALASLLLSWARDAVYLILWAVAIPAGLCMLVWTILHLIKPGGIKL